MKKFSQIVVKKGAVIPKTGGGDDAGNVVLWWIRAYPRRAVGIVLAVILCLALLLLELSAYRILKSEAVKLQSALAFARESVMAGGPEVTLDFGRDDERWYCARSRLDESPHTNRLPMGIRFMRNGERFSPPSIVFKKDGRPVPDQWTTDLGYPLKYRGSYSVTLDGVSAPVMERRDCR